MNIVHVPTGSRFFLAIYLPCGQHDDTATRIDVRLAIAGLVVCTGEAAVTL